MAGISPWVRGQTSPIWQFGLARDTTIFDLAGQSTGNISMLIYNAAQIQVGTGVGTVVIVQATPAIITYQCASIDTSGLAAGNYYIRFKVLFGGTSPDFCDYYPIVIQN